MLSVLDLFSGIGGFSLGLERATLPTGQHGFRTVAFCERDGYATAVLNRHWPGVPVYRDVCSLTADTLHADGVPTPDVVCGGFPCQDISFAGAGAGLSGARSGLWFAFARIIAETRPRYVIAENVAALRSRGLDTVLGSLAALGYDAEWHCIPASALGAPHRRDRVWIVAYPDAAEWGTVNQARGRVAGTVPLREGQETPTGPIPGREDVAYADHGGEPGRAVHGGPRISLPTHARANEWWATEPDVGRMAYGVPARMDRLRCLGNAVVPQIPQIIGQAILNHVQLVSNTDTETPSP